MARPPLFNDTYVIAYRKLMRVFIKYNMFEYLLLECRDSLQMDRVLLRAIQL